MIPEFTAKLVLVVGMVLVWLMLIGAIVRTPDEEPEQRHGEPGLVYIIRWVVWMVTGSLVIFRELAGAVPGIVKWLVLPKRENGDA